MLVVYLPFMGVGSLLTLNADLVAYYCKHKSIKQLHAYAIAVYTTRGLGYMEKQQFLKSFGANLSVSQKTAYRRLTELMQEGIVREAKGILYILGKSAYLKKLGISSRLHFKARSEDLFSYQSFRRLCINQTALRLQERFRYNHKKIIQNDVVCPWSMKRIEYPISRDKAKVGCSLSYLSNFLGISKSNAGSSLNGFTIKNYEFIKFLSYKEFTFLLNSGYLKSNYMVKVIFSKDKVPMLFYLLPSIISLDKQFCRRGLKTSKFNTSSKANNKTSSITSTNSSYDASSLASILDYCNPIPTKNIHSYSTKNEK